MPVICLYFVLLCDLMFMSRERKPNKANPEFDTQTRKELVDATEERMLEALQTGLLDDCYVFGHQAAVVKVQREAGDSVRLYRPSEEARNSGYLPELWVEFTTQSFDDGCFLEVWPDRDQLVRPVGTEKGIKPEPLPVSNTRVMVARARNITIGGVLVSPTLVNN